ncbi:transport protein Avl9-domain-containing protein [Mycena maculata]|uniref:Transport protein Avl9-domain-containing protein n=1 Tax=Mycena maculata TaxID=230809 RepID=A0AAD7IGJ9_9AGAR|nr:transport protein Avl9-domain-containing protein [Mycena maculata]
MLGSHVYTNPHVIMAILRQCNTINMIHCLPAYDSEVGSASTPPAPSRLHLPRKIPSRIHCNALTPFPITLPILIPSLSSEPDDSSHRWFFNAFGPLLQPNPSLMSIADNKRAPDRIPIFNNEEETKILPFIALHISAEDYSYFHLVLSGPNPTTIFGISCNQQISVSVKMPNVIRSTMQKAIIVLTSKPIFGPIQDFHPLGLSSTKATHRHTLTPQGSRGTLDMTSPLVLLCTTSFPPSAYSLEQLGLECICGDENQHQRECEQQQQTTGPVHEDEVLGLAGFYATLQAFEIHVERVVALGVGPPSTQPAPVQDAYLARAEAHLPVGSQQCAPCWAIILIFLLSLHLGLTHTTHDVRHGEGRHVHKVCLWWRQIQCVKGHGRGCLIREGVHRRVVWEGQGKEVACDEVAHVNQEDGVVFWCR